MMRENYLEEVQESRLFFFQETGRTLCMAEKGFKAKGTLLTCL